MGVGQVGRVVCVPCRLVSVTGRLDSEGFSHCLICDGPVIRVGPRWRAPRKHNKGAWKRVEAGELLWDHKAVERPLRRRITAEQWQRDRERRQKMKAKQKELQARRRETEKS